MTILFLALPACQGPAPASEKVQVERSALVTPTFVQRNWSTPQTPQTSVGVLFIGAQTTGDLNVVVAGWNDSTASVTTVTDSAGNTYHLAIGPTRRTGAQSQSIYYANNIVAAGGNTNTVTVHFSPAATSPDIRIAEYAGVDKVNPLDVTAGMSGSSTSTSSGAAITTFRTDLLVAANTVARGTTGPGTGYTSRVVTTPDEDILEDRVVTTAGSNTATAPQSPSGTWVMQMAAFRALDNTVPTAPSNLTASVVSASKLDLSWTAATDDTGVTGYSVERCQGANCSTFAVVGTPTTTTFANTGLLAATSYSFRVRAKDAAGNSGSYSSTASATTTNSCTSSGQCSTGFCVGGVCCNSACNGGCGSCTVAGHLGACTAVASGTSCRAANGACDAAESCDGSSLNCPADGFLPSTTVCRSANGGCDVAENCTGTSAVCPGDAFAPSTTVCRPANGVCDVAENCTGMSAACPSNGWLPDHTACNDNNVCTINDTCTSGVCSGPSNPGCNPSVGLTTTQLAAAKQAGNFPTGYLTPTFYDPIAATSDETDTIGEGINNAGVMIGLAQAPHGPTTLPQGSLDAPFVVDSAGQHALTLPFSTGPSYPFSINDSGYILAGGGPTPASDWLRPIIYHPGYATGGTFDLPWRPIDPASGTNVRFEPTKLNNTIGTTGLPTAIGLALFTAGGALAVWHLDGNGTDAIGPSALPLPSSPTWVTGHTTRSGGTPQAGDQALSFDGNTCLQASATSDTAPYNGLGVTMLGWVKPDSSMCPGSRAIVTRGSELSMWLGCNATNTAATVNSFFHTTTGDHTSASVGTVPFGQWSHVAVAWDGNRLQTYVNGTRVGDEAMTGRISASPTWMAVGCWPSNPANNFKGAIDEVSVFAEPMGADEIGLNARDITNYQPFAQNHFWSEIRDGFFSILTTPSWGISSGGTALSNGYPESLSDSGVIVGYFMVATTAAPNIAAIFDPQVGWVNLNELIPPDSGWDLQDAWALKGNLVTGIGLHDGVPEAYRLDVVTHDFTDLGAYAASTGPIVGPPSQILSPIAMNSAGHIVGGSNVGFFPWANTRAFIYTDADGMSDLNDFIDPAAGWTLVDATGINDNEQIVGIAQKGGQYKAFKLAMPNATPCPPTQCRGPGSRDLRTGLCRDDGPAVANGIGCSDGNACTALDQCVDGECRPGPNVACPSDSCHSAGTCDPASGLCAGVVSLNEGSECDDGNSCTAHALCTKGVCVPEDPITGCPAPGAAYYAPLTNLGSRQGVSSAVDINNSSVVAGNDAHYISLSEFAGSAIDLPFRWSAVGGIQELPRPPGRQAASWAISDDGEVVGASWDTLIPGDWIYRYDPAANQVDDSQITGDALAINPTGQYTGVGLFSDGHSTMYRAQSSVFQEIPLLSGYVSVYGRAIDRSGNIVGLLQHAVGGTLRYAAMRYSDSLGYELLNNLIPPGSDWDLDPVTYNSPYGTNGTQIVGPGLTGTGKTRGFVLTPSPSGGAGSATIVRIDPPPAVPDDTNFMVFPSRINAGGEVVGTIANRFDEPYRAFVWTPSAGTVDLNEFVDPNSGWVLQTALGINDGLNGNPEIVGDGLFNGQKRAYKMRLPDLSPCLGGDICHTVGPRILRSGRCPEPTIKTDVAACQEGISLRMDGVVDMGGGKLVALFGFTTAGTSPVRPSTNVEAIDGITILNPQPPLPIQFPPGDHPGAFLPQFNSGQTITWTVDGETISASSVGITPLEPETFGTNGKRITIGGTVITLQADTSNFLAAPSEPVAQTDPTFAPSSEFFGTLKGNLSVTPSGAATYTVPIMTPPGIAGMAPNLNLVYSSQGDDGIAGQGWNLTGLSMIYRCPKTVVQDGHVRPVVMDELVKTDGTESDGLCLDGERLFEDPAGSGKYRAEHTDFSIIELNPAKTSFFMRTKSGKRAFMGTVRMPR